MKPIEIHIEGYKIVISEDKQSDISEDAKEQENKKLENVNPINQIDPNWWRHPYPINLTSEEPFWWNRPYPYDFYNINWTGGEPTTTHTT